MQKYALVVTITIALFASLVSEAAAKLVKARISGSVNASDVTSGPCAPVVDTNGADTYDTMCPAADTANCKCINASNLLLSGSFGRGTANLIATADESSTVETSATDPSACSPAFAVVTLSIAARGKVPAKTQTLNALGAVCGAPGTTTVSLLGGFSIEDSSSQPPAMGSGTFNGTVSVTGQVSITLAGLINNP